MKTALLVKFVPIVGLFSLVGFGGKPVAVYSGTITGITKGAHNVAVFESYGGGPARLVASRSVTVASGSNPDI